MDAHQDLPQISSWPFSPSCCFIPCLSVISNPWLSRLSATTGLELHPQVKWGSPHRKPVPCCLHPNPLHVISMTKCFWSADSVTGMRINGQSVSVGAGLFGGGSDALRRGRD